MKIHIEVEIDSHEIAAAREIFGLLKQLSERVTHRNIKALFASIFQRIANAEPFETVLPDLAALCEIETDEYISRFYEAFWDAVFVGESGPHSHSSVPFISLLPSVPQAYLVKLRELVARVLQALAIPRAVDCNRLEFFVFAEAFAAFVKAEFIPISGAVTTISALLKKQETRAAAVTMLGKTIELCIAQLHACDPAALSDLMVSLAMVTEETFQYDLQYIRSNMSWVSAPLSVESTVLPSPSAQQHVPQISPTPVGSQLKTHTSFQGHNNTIFSLILDPRCDLPISADKDGKVIAWGSDGCPESIISLKNHYACAMDMSVPSRTLLLCGIPKTSDTRPAIIACRRGEMDWEQKGELSRPDAKLISCVRALSSHGSSFTFATGDSFDKVRPVISFDEHQDIITTLCRHPTSDGLFFSGSRDCTIKMWDSREKRGVLTLAVPSFVGSSVPHEMMVTCLEAFDHYLLSGSLDKTLALWDLRNLKAAKGVLEPVRRIQVDEKAVLKAAVGPQFTAAVSTLDGLYLVNLHTGASSRAPAFPGRELKRIHDVAWHHDILYAAGDSMMVDVYQALP